MTEKLPRSAFAAILVLCLAPGASAAEEGEEQADGRKWLSFNAFADVETAYICRGYVWDKRPFSAQYAAGELDLGLFGKVEASVWTQSAMSRSGTSSRMRRYAYAEADYLLRYCYDIDFAPGWRLRNGIGRQWVTNPGYVDGHTVTDFQALQVLQTPWAVPYWRLRVLRHPIDETYWVAGVKRSFGICEGLAFTVDFFGDLGDRRHYRNLYGRGTGFHGGLQALNLVLRLDYRLMEHVGLFAFAGQFCLVSGDARDAVKAMDVPEAKRDLTFGGVGLAVDF